MHLSDEGLSPATETSLLLTAYRSRSHPSEMYFFQKIGYYKNMRKKFITCGLTGWCMEILFTALSSFRRRELKLMGVTSLWMFPIYGMAVFLQPIYSIIKNFPFFIRGGIYSILIFTFEYLSGNFLKKRNLCPWDYSNAKYNLHGLIRFDYAPFWALAGLLFERILIKKERELFSSKNNYSQ